MDSRDKIEITVWTLLITSMALVLSLLISWGIIGTNNDHDFDVKCIQSGKSLVYAPLEGESYAKKVCK